MQKTRKVAILIMLGAFVSQICAQDSSFVYYNRAKSLFANWDFCAAIKEMDKVIKMQPTDTGYEFRAALKYDCQDYRGAREDYGMAIKLNKREAKYYLERAMVPDTVEGVKSAIEDCSEAIQLNPKSGGYRQRGDIYKVLKKYKEAIKDYTRQIKATPGDSSSIYYSYQQRGISNYFLENFKDALRDLDSSNCYATNNRIVFEFIAKTKKAMGLFEAGCADYLRAQGYGYKEFDDIIQKYCKK